MSGDCGTRHRQHAASYSPVTETRRATNLRDAEQIAERRYSCCISESFKVQLGRVHPNAAVGVRPDFAHFVRPARPGDSHREVAQSGSSPQSLSGASGLASIFHEVAVLAPAVSDWCSRSRIRGAGRLTGPVSPGSTGPLMVS